jgi:rhodanese-related sulfurtransferase
MVPRRREPGNGPSKKRRQKTERICIPSARVSVSFLIIELPGTRVTPERGFTAALLSEGPAYQFIRAGARLDHVQPAAGALCLMAGGYQADVTPAEAWRVLSSEPGAVLVDVRTAAEWNYVGLPDLSEVTAPLLKVEWQSFPSGAVDPRFAEKLGAELKQQGRSADAPLFFICRSGARSASAAAAMTAAGYSRCYNVAGGFEGGRDGDGHRGTIEGWKAANLPWVQS